MLFFKESKICEPIFKDPFVLAVLNRFDIYLGVGDDTIEEICCRRDIDVELFIAVLNTYMNSDYYPSLNSSAEHLAKMVDYLEKTDIYYRDVQLKNIDRHFDMLLRSTNVPGLESGNMELLGKFYCEVKEELQASIKNDCEYWFPMLRKAIDKDSGQLRCLNTTEIDNNIPLPFRNKNLEDKIKDLISFFIIHLKGDYNHNLCLAVVSAIFALDKDVCQNNRIRERIFRPLCEA